MRQNNRGRTIENSIAKLAKRYDLNPKTIVKWKKRSFTQDATMGPKQPRSTVLTKEEEVVIVAFRKYTLLPLDDCLYSLYPTALIYIVVCKDITLADYQMSMVKLYQVSLIIRQIENSPFACNCGV